MDVREVLSNKYIWGFISALAIVLLYKWIVVDGFEFAMIYFIEKSAHFLR
ncbi:hypothetical protein YDYSY3_39240 [Paenibacillus chitinolyticus]|nr:hypothetical protein [Paenibacillus chitinolyticus]GKS12924.1 hypothetical protein YDYSY3_39240 [Paenibacillus chitinolyticus]